MRKRVSIPAAALALAALLVAGCGKSGGGAAEKAKPAAAQNLLQIADVVPGTGEQAKPDDYVCLDYTAWAFQNGARGAQIVSTADTGTPETLPLDVEADGTLGKMAQAISGMKVGGKRTFVIPPDPQSPLAARIPQGASIQLEVTLVSIPRVQQQTLVSGNGPEAKRGDVVDVHYTGWLWENGAKGKKFDSSLDSGQPLHFQLGMGRVIRGWDVGVEGMRVGEKRQLIIPPELAYGKRGTGGVIPPNATLLFEVQLLKVEGK